MRSHHSCAVTALFAAISVALSLQAVAAEPADPAPTQKQSLETIIVTGTRSSNRTEAESLSPIDVLSPADLNATGSTDLATALGNLLPSLDFPRPAINDGNDALRPATLRGLSPDQVLVLVDGKRYHTSALVNYNYSIGRGSAPVDLNSIPIAAIDHIEVLRDGASAQYGSDAIAGVINIVLKHGAKDGSNEVTINGGKMTKGDGAENGASASYGMNFGATDGDGKAPGWARLSLNYQDVGQTNRATNTDRNSTNHAAGPLPVYPDGTSPGYERYGDPAVVTYQAVGTFGYTFSPAVELYGYVDASRRDVTSNGFYRYYNSARNVPQVYPDGFLPQIVNHTNDLNSVIGLRGTLDDGWHWDLSAAYGKNHLVFDIRDTINTNLFYSLGASPTYFYAGTFSNAQTVLNADVSRDFNVGFLPNAVTVAGGLEYRREQYTIRPGQPESYYFNPATLNPDTGSVYAGGSQVFPGLSPAVAGSFDRDSKAAYIDFETNITDKLSAGFAARYEDYSDAGATRSGKFSARYQFTDTFALRGTISNGFRAPSLAQENYESVTTLIQNGVLAQIGTYRTSDPVAIALGAKPLTPEKSTNYSFGSVWTPFENFTTALDIYQIRINNEILYSDQLAVSIPNSQVQGAQFFVNGADTRTRGVDLINSYRIELDRWGAINLTASGNWNQTSVIDVKTPALFGRASQGLLTYGTPRTKYIFGSDWLYHDVDLHAGLTRYGAVTRLVGIDDLENQGASDEKFSARWLLDIAASYKLDAWTFTLGADNLTNVYPTKANVAVSNGFGYEDIYDGLQYSALSPFGFNGRYVYAKINYKF